MFGMACNEVRPNGLAFSCRLAAFANVTTLGAEGGSKMQKSSDLARSKAVGCNHSSDRPYVGTEGTRRESS